MSTLLSGRKAHERLGVLDTEPLAVLNALPQPLVVVDAAHVIRYVNLPAQEFFELGESAMIGQGLSAFLPADSPVFLLTDQALTHNTRMIDFGVPVETPRIGRHVVTVTVGPMGDPPNLAVLTLHEVSLARSIDNQLTHRSAARSVTGMAAILAHEIKNPLSGIRGAAQLLEHGVDEPDRELTRLICQEADRIVALVDRMEAFSDGQPIERAAVNIHAVLEHVRRIAQSGFARHVRFVERYDPSLPPVFGNRDQLIQALLNLVKNAAEAVEEEGGEIVLSTRYQRGVSIAARGTDSRVHLPLRITVQDNGGGIPEDLHDHLFDPFVTTRMNGTGLGLALVAKIVGDHGGVIGFESQPRRTLFKVSLPMYAEPRQAAGQGGA